MNPGQLSFEHLDVDAETPLAETTFVVVDLETTGARASAPAGGQPDAITEIGAVKVRGGIVLGEFATLVDPQRGIPPQITQLTGITTAMVRSAPTIDTVLPAFLEFAGLGRPDSGVVLVAHNAGFDVGFLRAAAESRDIAWPRPPVLCTVRLSRRILSREEAPSVRLAELARLFGIANRPTHRALDDARATVDVLHALIERVGNTGVHSYADLRSYLTGATPAQRSKRVLAQGLPHRPGVYLFRGPSDEVLYVGTATDLRRRVGQYFNGSDRRHRIAEMVTVADRVDHVECAHPLEAGVRELRLLAAHAPPYNRRSKFPRRWWWVTLTAEAFPRLSVTRAPSHDRAIGPFHSRTDAAQTAALLARFTGVRTCTKRFAQTARHICGDREVAACPAARDLTAAQYAPAVQRAAALIEGTENDALVAAVEQVTLLGQRGRYETAARLRDQTATAIETLWRGQRLRALVAVAELVAAAPDGAGGWQLAVIRHGQLAAAGCAAAGVPPLPVVDAIRAGAQVIMPERSALVDGGDPRRPVPRKREVPPPQAPPRLRSPLVEETALIVRWLTTPGVRIVGIDGTWAEPLASAGPLTEWAATARSARLAAAQLAEQVSELGAEPHPTREQLFGRTGVDRLGGARQPVLPSRQPFGATG